MSAVRSDCITTYHASRSSGTRNLEQVRWVVLHVTEGGTAKSNARYFADPRLPEDGGPTGSAHLVVDDVACYRCLRNNEVPWAAPGANHDGFHIEQCGFSKWPAATWRTHSLTLQRAAYKTAFHCHLFGIPAVFRWARGLEEGKPGVTTHAQCSRAFGGDHTDPGKGWPQQAFMELVRGFYDDLAGNVNV